MSPIRSIGRYLALPAVLLLAGVPACGSDDPDATTCEANQPYPCACADGTQSTQTCDATGSFLNPCACNGPAGSGGGINGGSGGALVGSGGLDNSGGNPGSGGVDGSGGVPGSGGNPGSGGDPGSGGAGPVTPGEPRIPSPSGACPNISDGTVMFNINGTARSVRIWLDAGAAAGADGPVVFYWYGTGGQPTQATSGLGSAGISRITGAGGIVVAPTHNNTGIFPWIQSGDDRDLLLMDQVVACAREQIGIDARHIHSLGFSAGALFTGQVGYGRSAYIASVATYSGGGTGMVQDPSNKYAAMILHGGPGDMVVLNFQDSSIAYKDALTGAGHFAFICNHGGGHVIPPAAVPNVVQFFFDHPYGTSPSPYQGGFPNGFPSYCVR